ncbi:MAG: ferulic acid esterase [Ktedonobacteraceae bacterium]|nr:ferulic acid esterase [Ktedonobacteraceae bacterium]
MLTSCGTAPQISDRSPTRATVPIVAATATIPLSNSGVVNRPVVTTGCGKASSIRPGSTADVAIAAHPALARGKVTRSYLVHIPAGYIGNQLQAVVLVFHGHGGDAAGAESSSGFSTLADQHSFLAVYPQGLLGDDGLPFWASIGPIDYGIDDALFVSDVLNKLQTDFCVDPHRIYATGFSNGGGMSGFLACKLALRIAALAPISGNYYDLPSGCHPGRPVPILEIHGTADPIVPYAGIPPSVNPVWHLPAITQWLQDWASRDGCTQGPVVFLQKADVTGEQWLHCNANTAVLHYRMEGEGHSLPSVIGGQSTAAILWGFFQAHPLPNSAR